MMYNNKPHFIIKKNLQKSKNTNIYFCDEVTPDILKDVCIRITGQSNYTYEYVKNDYSDDFLEKTYNKGRMALMFYKNIVHYISFSEKNIDGRNSSVQSVPTAFNIYYNSTYPNKKLYYYFLNVQGNAETNYQLLIYRLMNTVGFEFLNANEILRSNIKAYSSIDDIMFNRRINSHRNKSNNSTYITKNDYGEIEIYGKTYGANKYETSLMCYALSGLREPGQVIKLYEILEGNLKELPKSSLNVIGKMGGIDVVPIDRTLEKKIFKGKNSLRSPRYIYNLLSKLGNKHCALCSCEIPEIVQGAHIWPVADIKRNSIMNDEEKLNYAIDGENGVWLCENHHKLFDSHMITFDDKGRVRFKSGMEHRHITYIDKITTVNELPDYILTDKFVEYIWRREHTISNL